MAISLEDGRFGVDYSLGSNPYKNDHEYSEYDDDCAALHERVVKTLQDGKCKSAIISEQMKPDVWHEVRVITPNRSFNPINMRVIIRFSVDGVGRLRNERVGVLQDKYGFKRNGTATWEICISAGYLGVCMDEFWDFVSNSKDQQLDHFWMNCDEALGVTS